MSKTALTTPALHIACLALGLVAYGCAAPAEDTEQTSSSRSSIVGGRSIGSEESPSAVGWLGGQNYCTGVVVSSRSILTAAHCVLDSRSVAGSGHRAYRDLSGIWLTNGGNFTMAAGARWFRVQRVAAHESFPDASDRHDIALIQVEGDLQLPAAMLANGLSAGSAMTSVGYGCNNNPFARSGGGIRRTASAYVDNLSEATFESVGGEICPGDSGGPALVPSTFGGDQTSVVAGVASWLFWNHERQVTRSVYARVDTAEMHAWLRAEDPAIVTDAPNGVDNSNGNNTF